VSSYTKPRDTIALEVHPQEPRSFFLNLSNQFSALKAAFEPADFALQ
jgi:hypothetical protein